MIYQVGAVSIGMEFVYWVLAEMELAWFNKYVGLITLIVPINDRLSSSLIGRTLSRPVQSSQATIPALWLSRV
jgi:hypothetical protein